MHKIRKVVWVPFLFILAMIPIGSPQAQPPPEDPDEQGTVLVGRISHVEGQLLRYVPDEEDWVVTVRDTPFGEDDALHSGEDGRAEFIMPNNTWVRIGGDTQIQLMALKDDITEIDVTSGVARFYNKSSYGVIKATTPFGYLTAPSETIFDLYVGDDSVEVIALKGTLDFVHHTSETRYEVMAGSTSILADIRQVTAGKGDVDPDWDKWNREGDALWAERMEVKGKSVEYLPPSLHHEAYIFEEHGRWENVYYEGAYYYFWRPIHISVGWAPFTVGRWTLWCGDHTWIPYEPFGYVTHHYGNWVLVRNCWYWAPPLARVRPGLRLALLDIGSAWYPGRVAWIHYGTRVGWVPLAPREPYYCHRRWGPRAVVVKNVNITNLNFNISRYKHFKRAIIINRHHLYTVNNYRNVRIRHTNNDTILKKYRVAPVVDNRVINDYNNIGQRHNFTNINVRRRPDRPVIKRIQRNRLLAKQGVNPKARRIRQKVSNTGRDRLEQRVGAKTARVQNRLVSANRPAGSVSQLKLKKLKSETRRQAENQRRPARKLEKESKSLPHGLAKRQEAKRQDPRHVRKPVQSMQQRRKPPRSVTRKEVQADNQRRASKKQGKVLKRKRQPGPDQQLAPVEKGYRKREEPKKTRQDRQIRVSGPRQENPRRDIERQKNVIGWNSQRYFPSPQVTGRPRSSFGSGRKN